MNLELEWNYLERGAASDTPEELMMATARSQNIHMVELSNHSSDLNPIKTFVAKP